MLAWIVTIFLTLSALVGWLFLKRNSDHYLYGEKSSINFFFRWGNRYHHFFKVAITAAFMIIIFSLYKYLLSTSNIFATTAALIAGIVLSGGKELLDKYITLDDIIASVLGVALGFLVILLFF